MAITREQALALAAARKRAAEAKQRQPAEKPTQGVGEGLLDAFTQGASLGFGDELTGLEAAVLGRTPEGGFFDYSQPFGERYSRAVAAERGQQDQFAAERPVASTVAEIGGALATGAGAARSGLTLAGRGGTAAGRAGLGAVEGMAYGGAYGAGEADEGSRLAGAGFGAAAGAAAGGALTAAGDRVVRALTNRAAIRSAPSGEVLRRGADAAYDAARARNPQFPAFGNFVAQASQVLKQEGFHPRLHPKVAVALDEFAKLGPSPDFKTVEQMRRIAGSAAKSIDPDERRLGKMLIEGLDNFVEVSSPVPEVKVGRQLYGRFKRGEMIDDAIGRAGRRADSTGSGGNANNAIRQNIRAILDNPKKRRGFNAEEIAAMELVVRGEPLQNAFRLVGKLSPSGNGLMAALGLGATVANPMMAAAPATGMVAKALADRGTRVNADVLSALVRSGGQMPQPPAMIGQMQRQALIDALAGYAGGRTARASVPAGR